jgi:hypothetical protein
MPQKYWWVDEKAASPGVTSNYCSERNMAGTSQHWVRFSSSSEAHAFVKNLKKKHSDERKQNQRNKQHEGKQNRDNEKKVKNNESGKARFHGLYCLCIGWWLAMLLVCCIVPLFSNGGRRLIKKAFGFW